MALDDSSDVFTVTPSTVGVEWKNLSSDLATNCVCHYSLRNDGSEVVSASPIFFHNSTRIATK